MTTSALLGRGLHTPVCYVYLRMGVQTNLHTDVFLGAGHGAVGSKIGPGTVFSNPEARIIFLIFLKKIIYFWLHWVFDSARGLFLVVASRGYSVLWCFSWQWPFLLRSVGSRHSGFSSCSTGAL